jgi:hypothetical protein
MEIADLGRRIKPLLQYKHIINSFTPRLEQTTSSAHNFSKSKVWMGKYLKKSCSYYQCEQCFFKYFPKYLVSFSRRRCQNSQNSKIATLGLNELTIVIMAVLHEKRLSNMIFKTNSPNPHKLMRGFQPLLHGRLLELLGASTPLAICSKSPCSIAISS